MSNIWHKKEKYHFWCLGTKHPIFAELCLVVLKNHTVAIVFFERREPSSALDLHLYLNRSPCRKPHRTPSATI